MASEYKTLLNSPIDQLKIYDRLAKTQIDLQALKVSKVEGLSTDLFKNGEIVLS